MTKIRSTLHLTNTTGLQLYAVRQRLTNNQRDAKPLNEEDALLIARDERVNLDGRVLALHRAMDVAVKKSAADCEIALIKIADAMLMTFNDGELPMRVMLVFSNRIQNADLRQLIRQKMATKSATKESTQIAA